MTVELRHLRCFLAVAEQMNITRAAAVLQQSQPVVSRTLRQLEQHLGLRLVDRSTHHLELTPAGEQFRVRAALAVGAIDDALDPTKLARWPLRLGYAWSALGRHTPGLLRRWTAAHPEVRLELTRVDDRTSGLATGAVDVAIVRGPVPAGPWARRQVLLEAPRAVVAADSPLAAREALVLADLVGETVVVNTVSGSTTPDLWPAAARPTDIRHVTSTDDWLVLIAADQAVGVTSEATEVMHAHPGVRYLPLTDAPRLPVTLIWPEPVGHPAVPALVTLTFRLLQQPGTAERPG